MKDYPHAEQVTGSGVFSIFILNIDHLRGNKSCSPTACKCVFVSIDRLSQSEVTNHAVTVILPPKEDVLGFYVPVHDFLLMHCLQPL